jgi:hypothetical protein
MYTSEAHLSGKGNDDGETSSLLDALSAPPEIVLECRAKLQHAKLGARRVEQDLMAIRSRIESAGSFELRDESSALRLYAYWCL